MGCGRPVGVTCGPTGCRFCKKGKITSIPTTLTNFYKSVPVLILFSFWLYYVYYYACFQVSECPLHYYVGSEEPCRGIPFIIKVRSLHFDNKDFSFIKQGSSVSIVQPTRSITWVQLHRGFSCVKGKVGRRFPGDSSCSSISTTLFCQGTY